MTLICLATITYLELRWQRIVWVISCVLFEAQAENTTKGGHQALPKRSLYFLTLPTLPNFIPLQLGGDQLPLQFVTHLEIK